MGTQEFRERARAFIVAKCGAMKVGQEIRIHSYDFFEAYPCGYPLIYDTPEQAFLSSMIGSAWGCWRIKRDMMSEYFIISKHKQSNKRHYADPDTEHLFKRASDGTLEFIELNKRR